MADAIPLTGLVVDQQLTVGLEHLRAAKSFALASFMVLVYDHAITFGDEVNRIWGREWTGASWLFVMNRYITELVFIVNTVSFHDPYWKGKACTDFLPFAGITTQISIGIAEIILILRTYALYQRSNAILAALATVWCGQMIVMGIALRNPVLVPLPEGTAGCILGQHGGYGAAFWLAPLAMDTVIFLLTIFKTTKYLRQRQNREHIPLLEVILRDGILYFLVIFVANLFNCLTYYIAPPDLKVVGASFSHLITIVMIARLQLNLRSDSLSAPIEPTSHLSDHPSDIKPREMRLDSAGTTTTMSSLSYFFSSTVTELGKDLANEKECEEVQEPGDASGWREQGCRRRSEEVESQIEMGPIRPVNGGMVIQEAPMFSPEESEFLESVIQVSSAMGDEV